VNTEDSIRDARLDVDSKADRLFLLAQRIAEQTQGFFETKGPGAGDQASLTFMRNLREAAKGLFGKDFSEKRVSDDVSFSIDFYLPDETTAVEVALGLHNPLTEFERDIFKCLLAREAGCNIDRLLLIAKPGGETRQAAPGPRAIATFVRKNFGMQIQVRELVPP
jgi:hypothetical protein